MVRIVCLFDKGSRFPLLIAEGLINHPRVKASFNKPVISMGRQLSDALSPPALLKAMDQCDYIFLPDAEHFDNPTLTIHMDTAKLWPKVVVYDFKDSPVVDELALEKCHTYFKRSLAIGPNRIPIPAPKRPIYPLNYGVLDAYLIASNEAASDRPIDIGFFFNSQTVRNDARRGRVFHHLAQADWRGYHVIIGTPQEEGISARQGVLFDPSNNPWIDYIAQMNRTKIIFTAFPAHCDGDSRTWEAMVSGALCFLDISTIPTPNYFEDGTHCFFFDAGSDASIRESIELAQAILQTALPQRTEIAQAGVTHAKHFHRSIHRVDYMLRVIHEKDIIGPSEK